MKTFKSLALAAVLLFSVAAFATTPTGTVQLAWGVTPCTTFNNGTIFATATLDGNGNYSFNPFGANLQAGTYCIYAHYQGDATHNPSDATPIQLVVSNALENTSTNVLATPNPITQGSPTTVSGTVTGL